jgi:hypothetical protein
MKYENINFISSEPIVAEVKQELKSYFEAGAISEVLIPTFIDQSLRKLKVMVLQPEETVAHFVNYKSELPCDFALLDRAALYDSQIEFSSGITTMNGYFYMSSDCSFSGECCNDKTEYFEQIFVSNPGFKISMKMPRPIRVYHGSKALCTEQCANLYAPGPDIIQINNNRTMSASFEEGCIYVRYFARPTDEFGIPKIPEILEVEEYIKAYLKFKFFEMLWHSQLDESAAQIERKFQYYKQDQLAKLQAAFGYLLTKTKQQSADSVVKARNKFVKYHII